MRDLTHTEKHGIRMGKKLVKKGHGKKLNVRVLRKINTFNDLK